MAHVPIWRRYLRFFGSDVRADVNDELGFHLDTKIRELTEQGMPPDKARAEAIRRFGDFAEREDFDVVLYWSLRNIGVGNLALIRATRSQDRKSVV